MSSPNLWPLVAEERSSLARVLSGLSDAQWMSDTLCPGWDVEDVVTHLVAASRTATPAWLLSMATSRFDTGRHNRRLISRFRRATPAETLEAFRATTLVEIAPLGNAAGLLGEIIVHGQDVARPLGLALSPAEEALDAVARFFASTNFAVPSKRVARGLRLESTDTGFVAGPESGPAVRGTTLALVMVMAGREAYVPELSGAGVDELPDRLG